MRELEPLEEGARPAPVLEPPEPEPERAGLEEAAPAAPADAGREAEEAEPELDDPYAGLEEVEPVPAEKRPRYLVRFRPWVFADEPPDARREPGLYWLGTKRKGDKVELFDVRVSGPIVCPALTRSQDRETFGRIVRFIDHDGRERQLTVSCSAIAGDGLDLVRLLLDAGLEVVPRQSRRLVDYIGTRNPEERVDHVTVTGWLADRKAFALPYVTIGRQDVVFQCRPAHRAKGPRSVGDFERWRATIGAFAAANWRMAFMLSVALSAPLYELLNISPGGFHFWGESSHGKSITQGAAASCWGYGGKPFVRGWRGTAVGLENAAALSNDLPLFLDEIKEAQTADFEAVLYFLINGQGRLRGAREGGLQETSTWRIVLFSNGEYPLEQHLRAAGADYPSGLRARVADIRVDDGRQGVFDDLCGFESGGVFAKKIEEFSQRDYGHAGPALVRVILERVGELEKLFGVARGEFEANDSVSGRVADRFAAAAVAGELAADAKILPWRLGFATEAARRAFEAWRAHSSLSDPTGALSAEDQAIVATMRGFLETQRARFQATGAPPPQNRAGFVETDRDGRELFRIFRATLESERCFQRWTPKRIAEALDKAGLLAERDGDKNRRWLKARIDGRQDRVLVVTLEPRPRLVEPTAEGEVA